jgi:hypothetical protein
LIYSMFAVRFVRGGRSGGTDSPDKPGGEMGKDSLRRALLALSLLAAVPALGGCAAPTSYAGISLAPGAADAELQDLAQRARAGDKQALLELGIRYEEGRGVPVNLARAERFYALAAAGMPGTTHVYVPPVRGSGGGVVAVPSGSAAPGLPEARRRLERLQLRHAVLPAGGDPPAAPPNEEQRVEREDTAAAHRRCSQTSFDFGSGRAICVDSPLSPQAAWERLIEATVRNAEATCRDRVHLRLVLSRSRAAARTGTGEVRAGSPDRADSATVHALM